MEDYKKFENGEEFWVDGKGKSIPRRNIKDMDIFCDQMVRKFYAKAEELATELATLKREANKEILEYLGLVAASYDTKYSKNVKGNFVFNSFDKSRRMQIVNQSIIDFDSAKLAAAKCLIDECIKDWSDGANGNLRILIDDAFKVDKKGCIDKARVLGLLQYKIEDDKWKSAMEALRDAITENARKGYIRFFRKVDDKMVPVILDIANVV